jgi:hypothetical protein
MVIAKYQSQEVAWNKLEEGPLWDYIIAFKFTSGTYSSGEEDFLRLSYVFRLLAQV